MAKDPAFLFYTADFLVGTSFFTDEQVGKYVRILCYQHQHGNLSKDIITKLSGGDTMIMSKFKKDRKGQYFNERLRAESDKRKAYSESRAVNRLKKLENSLKTEEFKPVKKKDKKNISKSYDIHMENEDEDENRNRNKDLKEIKKNYILWNKFALEYNLPTVMYISGERKANLIERMKDKEYNLEKIIEAAKESKFLLGKKTEFKISFDYIVQNEENFKKILEGKFKDGDTRTVKKRTGGIQTNNTGKSKTIIL